MIFRFSNVPLFSGAFIPAVLWLSPAVTAAELPADHAERMTRGLDAFEKSVRGILTKNCIKCHGDGKVKGDLDLTTREDLLRGGADGPAIKLFSARESLLVELISHAKEPHMPDKGAKLADAEIAAISQWIDDGAPYDKPLVEGKKPSRDRSVVTDEDRKWRAFLPLSKTSPPEQTGAAHPVDAFLVVKAGEKGVAFVPEAERRTLVRRAWLDLAGVPPPPEEVESFVRDESPDAWAKLIDRLLASPRHGERWARHWLDVARFAESSGFEHDYDREGAWHFRDFVIKALNDDMPYDQFVRWQLAGDEFEPDNGFALTATGFLGSGVFPTQITANEVERTRYDAMDDMLSTTSQAMLGLTVGCARCHDHKYDPIPAGDYYRMLSTFTTTVRSNIKVDLTPEKTKAQREAWQAEVNAAKTGMETFEAELKPAFDQWIATKPAAPAKALWVLVNPASIVSKGGATFKDLGDGSWLAEGANSANDTYTITSTVPLRNLTGLRLEALAHPSMKAGGPGRAANGNIGLSRITVTAAPASGGPEEKIFLTKAEADFQQNADHLSIAASLDDKPNTGWALDPQFGKDHAAVFTFAKAADFEGGAILKVKLDFALNTQHNIGRLRLSVMSGGEPSLKGDALPAAVAAAFAKVTTGESLGEEERAALFGWWIRTQPGWREREEKVKAAAVREPKNESTILMCGEGYTPVRMHTQGADFFNETYILKRGNAELKNGVASQSYLQALMPAGDTGDRWRWTPPAGAKYSGRRRSLANWMTDVEHGAGALLARVIVNRVWQHHFGRGIVATPDDFGRTGAEPTHPELLDWLANYLIQSGWRLKPLHRLMMTSAAYRQTTAAPAAAADPDNLLFCRRLPRRLEAEAARDCILSVSGMLDETMYGPGTKDERSRRRSIYFTVKRSELIGSMVAFDQPEPLVPQGRRPVTTVAPQALLLMNSPQVRESAAAFAKRLAPEPDNAARVQKAWLLCVSREPDEAESGAAVSFLETQTKSYTAEGKTDAEAQALALTDYVQVLFGLNEFIYEN